MVSVVNLILEIEKRPALYISKNYLSSLKAFIDGWCFGNSNIQDINILDDFQIWIENKYHITSNQSWADIIIFFSTDENEALYTFFKLFHSFINMNFSKNIL